jgi:hypothetical protein
MSAMRAGRRLGLALLATLLVAGVAGCGGGGSTVDRADTTPNSGGSQSPTLDLALPRNVPLRATGPADDASTRVIRRWLRALNRGDIERAAHYFALPSVFQNTGTPVLHIDNETERIAINLSLTCGARAEETGGAGNYTIVLFRLIERPGPGGGCGTGAGQTARGAVLVARGLIREWYRLPDSPDQAPDPDPDGTSA